MLRVSGLLDGNRPQSVPGKRSQLHQATRVCVNGRRGPKSCAENSKLDSGMSLRPAAAAAIGVHLLMLQAPSAHALPVSTAAVRPQQAHQSDTSGQHVIHDIVLRAPNVIHALSEEGISGSQQSQGNGADLAPAKQPQSDAQSPSSLPQLQDMGQEPPPSQRGDGQNTTSTPPSEPSAGPQSAQQEQPSTSAASPPPEAQPSGEGPADPPATPPPAAPATPPAPTATPPAAEDPQKAEEEQRKSLRKTRKSRIKELEDIRAELAHKQLQLLEREKELLDKDQTVSTLREELDLEKKLRALLTKEKDKAEEQAALSMGLCTGAFTLP